MKVTEAPIWWSFECKKCGAKCEAEPTDVQGRPDTDCDGDVVSFIPFVACGRCGNRIDVPQRKLTPLIFKYAQDNHLK